MSIEETVTRIVHLTGTCDQCGVTKTWDEQETPSPDALAVGFLMNDPVPPLKGRTLWFDTAQCVHDYIEANVIESLRHPEAVRT